MELRKRADRKRGELRTKNYRIERELERAQRALEEAKKRPPVLEAIAKAKSV